MRKRHATENVDEPIESLCGRPIAAEETLRGTSPALTIDNANPDCKTCLRVIASRIKGQP